MTIEQLKSAREANPFVPFTIHMADGRTHRVIHRDYISMSPGGRIAIVYHSDEACSYLDLLLVTELRIDAPAPRPATESAA